VTASYAKGCGCAVLRAAAFHSRNLSRSVAPRAAARLGHKLPKPCSSFASITSGTRKDSARPPSRNLVNYGQERVPGVERQVFIGRRKVSGYSRAGPYAADKIREYPINPPYRIVQRRPCISRQSNCVGNLKVLAAPGSTTISSIPGQYIGISLCR
jgi:hypothetical protein